MGYEIEHKYRVLNNSYRQLSVSCHYICQGYLSKDADRTVRVRVRDQKGYITIKGRTTNDTRVEYEYEIPRVEAEEMLQLCLPTVIEKRRYIVPFKGKTWEVDEFCGALDGLVVAEIELESSTAEYEKPDFIGENVTNDARYYNSNLSEFGLSQF